MLSIDVSKNPIRTCHKWIHVPIIFWTAMSNGKAYFTVIFRPFERIRSIITIWAICHRMKIKKCQRAIVVWNGRRWAGFKSGVTSLLTAETVEYRWHRKRVFFGGHREMYALSTVRLVRYTMHAAYSLKTSVNTEFTWCSKKNASAKEPMNNGPTLCNEENQSSICYLFVWHELYFFV